MYSVPVTVPPLLAPLRPRLVPEHTIVTVPAARDADISIVSTALPSVVVAVLPILVLTVHIEGELVTAPAHSVVLGVMTSLSVATSAVVIVCTKVIVVIGAPTAYVDGKNEVAVTAAARTVPRHASAKNARNPPPIATIGEGMRRGGNEVCQFSAKTQL